MSLPARNNSPGSKGMDHERIWKIAFGSTGDPPVPSGDSPDGMAATVRADKDGLFAKCHSTLPVGESPTGAGESPAPPIFYTGKNHNQNDGKMKTPQTRMRLGSARTDVPKGRKKKARRFIAGWPAAPTQVP